MNTKEGALAWTGGALTPQTLFSRESKWQSWLDVEAALAEVQGEMGIIPDWAAKAIRQAAKLENIGAETMAAHARMTMAPVLSLTRLLAEAAGKAGDYVHWGATTQNITQTGRILLMREADKAIRINLEATLQHLALLAENHSATLMAGRTNRQHALPITFGFKVAGWIEELGRAVQRLDGGIQRLSSLPFGGAVGAFHAFGAEGKDLQHRLAARFGLQDMLVPGRAINDIFADYVVQLCLLAMTVDRIASEIYGLMTQEIGELAERLDQGTIGSSTMPHKINPKFVVQVLAEASQLRNLSGMALETGRTSHEGDAAVNQLLSALLDDAVPLAWRMTDSFKTLLERLSVDVDRMESNVHLTGGAIATEHLMMKLAPKIGRAQAHDVVHHALDARPSPTSTVAEIMQNDPEVSTHLTVDEIRQALDPAEYCGDSERIATEAAAMARSLARQLATPR
ncbi:lyase family protein [Marinovum sp. 2_MG-2023]|uniref:lyase family protein n=1 Tax=unclassified Marinovum TaxID=2647166 RepID=UPI0026E34B75|nr:MULTISPECIES: lyase family protein [unclassified Marinovum]MDO6729001.1 lyase family protein [Marinovum sp. 2_MG-2023]MDO6779372.1 lyase family protein [Marinovum sp. 1_MG-2023]